MLQNIGYHNIACIHDDEDIYMYIYKYIYIYIRVLVVIRMNAKQPITLNTIVINKGIDKREYKPQHLQLQSLFLIKRCLKAVWKTYPYQISRRHKLVYIYIITRIH